MKINLDKLNDEQKQLLLKYCNEAYEKTIVINPGCNIITPKEWKLLIDNDRYLRIYIYSRCFFNSYPNCSWENVCLLINHNLDFDALYDLINRAYLVRTNFEKD